MTTTERNACRWTVERYQVGGLDGWRLIRRRESGGAISRFYRTREEAESQLAAWAANGRCRECGDVLKDDWAEPKRTRVLAEKLCFWCMHWSDLAAKADDPRSVRVSGGHYWVETDLPSRRSAAAGHAGRRFVIRFHDGRQVVTRNLWMQGVIPRHFRERLADNAVFVQED